MQDDDFILFERGAIMRYLAGKANSNLYPKDLRRRAIVDQRSLFCSIHIGSAMGKVFFNRFLFQIIGTDRNVRELDENVGFLNRFLPIIDTQLGRTKNLAAHDLSIADMTLLAWLDPAELSGVSLAQYRHLSAWRSKLKTESFYAECHRDYADIFKDMSTNAGETQIAPRAATA